jgi:hypothetical protein
VLKGIHYRMVVPHGRDFPYTPMKIPYTYDARHHHFHLCKVMPDFMMVMTYSSYTS